MSSSKGKRGTGAHLTTLAVAFTPARDHTLVAVRRSSSSPSGRSDSWIAHWYIDHTVASLTGLTTHDVLLELVNGLLRSLVARADYLNRPGAAVGIGAPLGATGGTVTQTPDHASEPTLPGVVWPIPNPQP